MRKAGWCKPIRLSFLARRVLRSGSQFRDGGANPSRHVCKGFLPIFPFRYRETVFGQGLELAETGSVPVTGLEDYGDDSGFASLVPFHRSIHFHVVAVGGGK